MSRYHPHVVVRRRSPNQSSRNGARPRIIVLHSTEGSNIPNSTADLRGCTDFLCRPGVEASSHVIVDGDGHSARLVADDAKAWTCARYNPFSLNIEQIGHAASERWTRDEIRETARWIARWSKKYNIPIRVGAVNGGLVTKPGIVTHKMLGVIGGGHVDPGPRYPLEACLRLARFYRGKLG
jgi:N-acetyl-anhydromuramyl-L-alanine amidase AmpD